MSVPEAIQIRALARRFRAALERTNFQDCGLALSRFPKDCCHHAAKLLGLFLFDQGFGLSGSTAGRHPVTDAEHVWLRRGDLDIDITADQFPEIHHKVIVRRCSKWHASFKAVQFRLSDLGLYDRRRAFYEKNGIYPAIRNNMRL